jgi:hypothetical protein
VRTIAVAFVLAGALAACDEPRPANPRLWTLFDVQALYQGGAPGSHPIAIDAGLPGGVRLDQLLDPVDQTTLYARPTIVEGYNGSYLTTEVWSHFEEVWLQPMYIPVTGWMMDGSPVPLAPNGGAWIFSVGAGSAFYSPFWQMVYFDVPADTAPGAITTARQVLDGHYPLHFGPGRTVSLVPGDVAAPMGATPPVVLTSGTAWVDGQPAPFIDFGKASFTWNGGGVIDEVPIYVFLMRDSEGHLVAPPIQTVAGTGPPGSGGPPAPFIAGQRRYASYWRLYTVTLPPAARVFSPGAALQTKLQDEHVAVITDYAPEVIGDVSQTSGWVALNALDGCFATTGRLEPDPMNTDPGKCTWLNSQAAIEANIDPSAIQRTAVTVTCPFVTLDTQSVSPVK